MLPNVIFSGFVSKIVSDCFDISKDKIKEAVKHKHQSLESQIYNITIEVLNKITYNRYKGQDILFDVAEKILKDFQNKKRCDIETVISNLGKIGECVDVGICEDFIKFVYCEISKEENFILYKEILLLKVEQGNTQNQYYFLSLKEELCRVIKLLEERGYPKLKDNKFKNNKKQKYCENWNSKLFLHMNNDKNPKTLANVFTVPDYKIHNSVKGIRLSNHPRLGIVIDKFINYNKTSTMLITGVPGIGKSSTVSWLANKYQDDRRIIILRFRDWNRNSLQKSLISAICSILDCNEMDLENKILILDGFDEMKALDTRKKLLNNFFNDIKDYKNFKCIVTSRPAYIEPTYFDNVLELLPFNPEKIEIFHFKLTGLKLDKHKINDENLNILGIPVILYMVIMVEIDITKKDTKPNIYNRIFAEKGGIFDKFFDGENQYSEGSQVMRDPENIKKYLTFLRQVAFMMFEKDELVLNKNECPIPELEFQESTVSILEFPIKQLFEYPENNIEFIHQSIYDYFVAEYFFMRIKDALLTGMEKKFAVMLGELLGKFEFSQKLYPDIFEFLKYRVLNSELKNSYDKFNNYFRFMLKDGMTYYINKKFNNIIQYEMNVFENMLELIYLWNKDQYEFGLEIGKYLLYTKKEEWNLSKVNLSGISLKTATLIKANLKKAILKNTDLTGANLTGANLVGANIDGIILDVATLAGTIFDQTQTEYLEKKYNLRGIKIYDSKTKNVISYSQYRKNSH